MRSSKALFFSSGTEHCDHDGVTMRSASMRKCSIVTYHYLPYGRSDTSISVNIAVGHRAPLPSSYVASVQTTIVTEEVQRRFDR